MERKFIRYYGVAVVLFLLWMAIRNQVWTNEKLFPGDMVMIYARDSGYYFLILRVVFLTFLLWGSYLLWYQGKSIYLWLSVIAYSGILLIDNFILGSKYLAFKLVHEPWEAAYPMTMFIGFAEALFHILFAGFLIWMIKDSRQKRLSRQENIYQYNNKYEIQ